MFTSSYVIFSFIVKGLAHPPSDATHLNPSYTFVLDEEYDTLFLSDEELWSRLPRQRKALLALSLKSAETK